MTTPADAPTPDVRSYLDGVLDARAALDRLLVVTRASNTVRAKALRDAKAEVWRLLA